MKQSIGFIIGILILGLYSCKKEQPELHSSTTECGCAQEVSADFTINEIALYNFDDEFITETDTIFMDRNVRFLAKEKDAEYTWIIGAETLHTQQVDRFFSSSLGGQNISVTLIVKKKVNHICFPLDDGIDTLTKSFHVANYSLGGTDLNIPTLMEGTYRLKNAGDSDSVDIQLDYFYENSQSVGNGIRVTNHDGNNTIIQTAQISRNFREVYLTEKLIGKFKYKLNGEAEFIFIDENVLPNKNYHLKGRKLF